MYTYLGIFLSHELTSPGFKHYRTKILFLNFIMDQITLILKIT